jgi:NADPH2:quinone reductase
MRAAWYERNGPAEEVLVVGELPDPEPGPGQVRVRVEASGINPADVKWRSGVGGRAMTHPRVVPGHDGAGVIDRVGAGVPSSRVGERAWVHAANYRQPFGTAAEYVVVSADRAITLVEDVPVEIGACLGVPALTAHRCVYADGGVEGQNVLVTGGAGAVGHYAIELAKYGGARVIATASTPAKQEASRAAGADHVLDYHEPDVAAQILSLTEGQGVDRVVDVAFGVNLPLSCAVIATNGVIASYSSDAAPDPSLPFSALMRRSVTIRTILVFVLADEALRAGVEDVTRLLAAGELSHPIAARYPLSAIAAAHNAVESGDAIGKVLVLP